MNEEKYETRDQRTERTAESKKQATQIRWQISYSDHPLRRENDVLHIVQPDVYIHIETQDQQHVNQ